MPAIISWIWAILPKAIDFVSDCVMAPIYFWIAVIFAVLFFAALIYIFTLKNQK